MSFFKTSNRKCYLQVSCSISKSFILLHTSLIACTEKNEVAEKTTCAFFTFLLLYPGQLRKSSYFYSAVLKEIKCPLVAKLTHTKVIHFICRMNSCARVEFPLPCVTLQQSQWHQCKLSDPGWWRWISCKIKCCLSILSIKFLPFNP